MTPDIIYLAALGISIIVIALLFFSRIKYKEWHSDVSIDYKKSIEAHMEDKGNLKVAKHAIAEMRMELDEQTNVLLTTRAELRTILSQKKSSEVRLGMDAEILAPFLEQFPYNPKDAKFLGEPIDFIIFNADKEVVFVEVKSGNSKLSPKQNKLKGLIEEGKVKFDLIRIKA